ncbi:MAG: electron transfer flavoprotein subunit beta/FixA family protein [Bacteroidales bacterium]|jgi:electron transfer flavoprotein beta subunit|nr:electron transfer flavoprotein subunit beta/FixA family protein [Bacteroidales bacterium]MDD3166938.1 electron transfer flavoprotein subunit beta/FixA family protein [Bacteroidales bacterium]MDD4770385.1 electron transfer flavoprotein subunit beta/FixA family protein [Bacteroidales bacterium]HKL92531.1 electron transfer flavoprotein subunit beta/FixA family protein [Bacteroidales bacterium]
MNLNILVLAKQVPDTRNVGKDAMTPEGTVNRSALPAIFNPEDLNALEQALQLKDRYPLSTVNVLTMGPFRAAEIVREALYRGADGGIVLSDRAFAGSDTLATSYALSSAIRKMGNIDIIFCGRQAIDGDTAQVGPQVAEKLGWKQITYAETIDQIDSEKIVIKRRIDKGVEHVSTSLPVLITVNGSAAECRPRNAKRVMKYKYARIPNELQNSNEDYISLYNSRDFLQIGEWCVRDIDCDLNELGLSGSPTKVKKVENVVFQAKESKTLSSSDSDIESLMIELIRQHTIG